MGKLTIKPLELVPRLPSNFEAETWVKLQATVASILQTKAPLVGGAHEEVYRTVEALCVCGMEDKLAQFLRAECDNHIRTRLLTACRPASAVGPEGNGDDVLLRMMHAVWQDHCDAMQMISVLFLYLDRTYIFSQSRIHSSLGHSTNSARSLKDIGVQLFRAQLDALPEVRDKTLLGLLRLIDADRCGNPAPQPLLNSLVGMTSKLGIYEASFEPALLERTGLFFKRESEELLERIPAAEYLRHCERRLEEEAKRCATSFEKRTEQGILSTARGELLKQHCDKLLELGFCGMVREHQVEDLERLFRLFSKVDALAIVRKAWCQAIKDVGAGIMSCSEDAEESKGIIPALIALRSRLNEILEKAFQSTSIFVIGLKDAFEEILSCGSQNMPSKLLSRHIDEVLRNEKACSERELEESIENVIGIFRFLDAKDAFEAFYKKDLSKRILLSRSSSADAEKLMIQKLRDECGPGFTSKLEGMFRDIEVSKATQAAFAEKTDNRALLDQSGIDFSVSVLTSGLWPTQPPTPDIIYPAGPHKMQEAFAAFYSASNTGKSLRWSPSLGQCTLRACYEGNVRKELIVSHFQALVLLLFNSSNSLTCRQIEIQTRIPTADLHRTLQSLALHKYVKLITKEPKTREVADEDVFTYNSGFSHKMYRIVVTQISPKEQHEEETVVEQRVFEDRQHEVDAAIVRIMKAKKTLSHNQLLAEVFSAISFPAAAADVKRRVESLIEREYLERDSGASTYSYLA